ncbi:MAG TPA: copper chaperone PCu(A)C [Alphaproteobacteria bacterium]|nr:copper chaperone PCu(A)C [Alphaproteobacteria bacterium]
MIRTSLALAAVLGTVSFLSLSAPARAGKEDAPASAQVPVAAPVSAANAYSFATAEGQANGAVFARIINLGDEDRILSAASPAAKTVELHEHVMEGDVMGMRKVDSIALPKGTLEMGPMGYHIMLIDLNAPLKVGETVPVTLTFEKAGAIDITASIVPPGQVPESEKSDAMDHGMEHDMGHGMDHEMHGAPEGYDANAPKSGH